VSVVKVDGSSWSLTVAVVAASSILVLNACVVTELELCSLVHGVLIGVRSEGLAHVKQGLCDLGLNSGLNFRELGLLDR